MDGQQAALDQCPRFPSWRAATDSSGRGRFRREVKAVRAGRIEQDRFDDRAPEPTSGSPDPASPNQP
jgi:hypothetical protein